MVQARMSGGALLAGKVAVSNCSSSETLRGGVSTKYKYSINTRIGYVMLAADFGQLFIVNGPILRDGMCQAPTERREPYATICDSTTHLAAQNSTCPYECMCITLLVWRAVGFCGPIAVLSRAYNLGSPSFTA